MIAPRGSKIEIGLDGQIQIIKPPREMNPRDYGQNLVGVLGQDELVLSINQDTLW